MRHTSLMTSHSPCKGQPKVLMTELRKQDGANTHRFRPRHVLSLLLICTLAPILTLIGIGSPPTVYAHPMLSLQDNGLGQKPLLGWSSWSSIRNTPTQARIEAQAQAMSTTLKSHGYSYINMDDFWYLNPGTTVDQYGRWVVDSSKFPSGIAALASSIHGLGLKFGIYLTPGIPVAAVNQNTLIEGTSYHARDIANTSISETNYNFGAGVMYGIDYSKPGAQAFVNSWANELASWGADFLKIDGVGDSDIGDIQAWSTALKQSGRSIYFSLSNNMDVNNANIWQQNANGWRIDGDVECYCSTLVNWTNVSYRFNDEAQWTTYASPGGWNDLDSLDVGNGTTDGLTNDERQSYMTLWAISAAPISLGDDLTKLDSYGVSLLTNDAVLHVDQEGVAAAPLVPGGTTQVWRAYEPDGSYTVALFNLGSSSSTVSVNWSDLGVTGSAAVTDLWSQSSLGSFSNSFSATLNSHASRLLKVVPASPNAVPSYEGESSANTLTGGAKVQGCSGCSGGQAVGFVGNGGVVTFNNIQVNNTGAYTLAIDYTSGEVRNARMSINGGTTTFLNFANTGSFSTVKQVDVTVHLNAGANTIAFSNPNGWAPDFDRITLPPQLNLHPTYYEAEASTNTLAGGARIASCSACSGGQGIGYIGNGGVLTINSVQANSSGNYLLIIDYIDADGGRTVNLSVNGAAATSIFLAGTNGASWDTSIHRYTTIIALNAGSNTIAFSNSTAYAPDIDRIGISTY